MPHHARENRRHATPNVWASGLRQASAARLGQRQSAKTQAARKRSKAVTYDRSTDKIRASPRISNNAYTAMDNRFHAPMSRSLRSDKMQVIRIATAIVA